MLYEFEVSGKTVFPVDMLRYQGCFPSSDRDVELLTKAIQKTYTTSEAISIKFLSTHSPISERWESFGWPVMNSRKV